MSMSNELLVASFAWIWSCLVSVKDDVLCSRLVSQHLKDMKTKKHLITFAFSIKIVSLNTVFNSCIFVCKYVHYFVEDKRIRLVIY